MSIMVEHVKNVTTKYNGSAAAWDVVNEALCDCSWEGSKWESCEEYMAGASNAETKVGH